MNQSEKIRIYEVGPRDGLQNEQILIPTEKKIKLVNLLSDVGFEKIEVTSFVSPKWVPQMADAREVMKCIKRQKGVTYAALTPNMKGFERACEAGAGEVAIFAAASETFSQKNTNCTIKESLTRFTPIIKAAKEAHIPVRGYVSCVIACPYEGNVAPTAVASLAKAMEDLGCYEISLGDTIGKGTKDTIAPMLEVVVNQVPAQKLAGHYHDTGQNAIENVITSLPFGLRTFDSAVGGLGGCPYAPGAKGNVSTSQLVKTLTDHGYNLNLDLAALEAVEAYVNNTIKAM